jgi:hypothetical protein
MTNPHRPSLLSCSPGYSLCRIKPAAPSRGSVQTGGKSILAWRMLQGFSMNVELSMNKLLHILPSNCIAERMSRTLFDIVRPLIIDCVIPTPFWGDAIHAACQIHNRLPSRSANNILPHQLWECSNLQSLPLIRLYRLCTCPVDPQESQGRPLWHPLLFSKLHQYIAGDIPALGPPTWMPNMLKRCQIY